MNNTVRRTITGVGIVGVIVASLLISEYVFVPVMLFAMIVCLLEFYRMTLPGRFRVAKGFATLAAVIMFITIYLYSSFGVNIRYVLLMAVPLAVVLIDGLYIKDKDDFDNVAYMFTSQVYIALPFSLMNLLAFQSDGQFNGLILLGFFVIVWATDVGGYVFGMTLGQKYGHKLFPSVSPKKSWEGVWGGLLFSLIAGAVLKVVGVFDFSWCAVIALTLILFVSSIYGDLIESKMKRHFEIKDSGSILPGHGGMLDRFDGALLAFPMGIIFLTLFNLI